MFKKFVLANALEAAFLTAFRARGPYFFLEVQLNYLWLFLDFSAYSDIAVGIGGLLGVATPENFNRPYLARNSIDFWERWHISLSQFIRRNLFIPIQVEPDAAVGRETAAPAGQLRLRGHRSCSAGSGTASASTGWPGGLTRPPA